MSKPRGGPPDLPPQPEGKPPARPVPQPWPGEERLRRLAAWAAQALGGRLRQITPPGATPNFWTCQLDLPAGRVLLLVTEEGAWALAGSAAPGALEFTWHEGLATFLAAQGVNLLTPAQLAGPVDPGWPGCAAADLHYWRPTQLGQALFHWWD
ncbi:hypothetical protein [Ideonella livida]|uniref:Uncharacterized protein n=1 Tax=Ideonella livida TaxID=2707176 RepID=A0A7C9PEI9_9BURK|nr:hypothetical protein [Ideonella livida]NDY89893.1 hypothetical protein [Ideonella livida]